MDTSEQRILMNEKAGEIQSRWAHAEGDYVFRKVYDFVDLIVETPGSMHLAFTSVGEGWDGGDTYNCDAYNIIEDFMWERLIWLPTQSQLQEMIPLADECHRIVDKLYDFTEWVKISATYVTSDCSMEQLWLAYVMWTLYQKIWSGTEWVKE